MNPMNYLTAYSNSLIVGAFVLAGISSGHAQTAEDILNKASAIYTNAKTYQATYHWEQEFLNADKTEDRTINNMAKVKISIRRLSIWSKKNQRKPGLTSLSPSKPRRSSRAKF